MPPDRSSFTALNMPSLAVPEWMGFFTLSAPPNSDLWRKPPNGHDTSTAPILYTALRNPFIAAEVTVSADWELEWDQAGLVIFAGAPPGRIASSSTTTTTTTTTTPTAAAAAAAASTNHHPVTATATPAVSVNPSSALPNTTALATAGTGLSPLPPPPIIAAAATGTGNVAPVSTPSPPAYVTPAPASKWVKVGLEFCNNACHATSVCATSEGADWSLTALPPHHARRLDLRVKIERIGYALWVWYEDASLGWRKIREVTWFFWGVEDKAVRVGVYASRPANFATSMYDRRHGGGSNTTQRNLCVDFEGLEIY